MLREKVSCSSSNTEILVEVEPGLMAKILNFCGFNIQAPKNKNKGDRNQTGFCCVRSTRPDALSGEAPDRTEMGMVS